MYLLWLLAPFKLNTSINFCRQSRTINDTHSEPVLIRPFTILIVRCAAAPLHKVTNEPKNDATVDDRQVAEKRLSDPSIVIFTHTMIIHTNKDSRVTHELGLGVD